MESKQYSESAFSVHWVYWVPSTPPKDESSSTQFKCFFCYEQLACPEIIITCTACIDFTLKRNLPLPEKKT